MGTRRAPIPSRARVRQAFAAPTPLQGGLLVSRLGKGTYVYTGLSFFRQLPAGVPGAFRLFLNLLDLKSRAPVP